MSEFENPPKPPANQPLRQWKLSALFLLVTLVAVAASGYSKGGARGLWIALFSSWFIVLGFSFILFGAAARSVEHFFMLFAGFVMLGVGLLALMTFSYW